MGMVKLESIYSTLNDEGKDLRGNSEFKITYIELLQNIWKDREQTEPTRQVFGL